MNAEALSVIGGLAVSLAVLFGTLACLALLVTGWAAAAVPTVPVLPRQRQTVLALTRRLRAANFLRPTLTLAAATAALATGVGFLPVIGTQNGMTPVITGAVVSLLAVTAVVVQPFAGRARDAGTLPDQLGMTAGIGMAAVGLFVAAVIPPVGGILIAAVLIGAGTGVATPIAFAHLAGTTPPERLGQTMGSAEVGRELGDAGGPLLVGAVAATVTLGWGLAALALALALIAVLAVRIPAHRQPPTVPR